MFILCETLMTRTVLSPKEFRSTARYLAEILGQLKDLAQSARLHDLAYLTALAEAEAKLQSGDTQPNADRSRIMTKQRMRQR